MTQAIDTELKELILGLDKKLESNTKAIGDLTLEMRVGFANVDKKLEVLDTRLIEVEKKIDKQDVRLWTFGGIILTAALGTIWKILL